MPLETIGTIKIIHIQGYFIRQPIRISDDTINCMNIPWSNCLSSEEDYLDAVANTFGLRVYLMIMVSTLINYLGHVKYIRIVN